jgi:hypothetical protein
VVLTALSAILLPLAVTVAIETPVAALFGLRRRALAAAASVSLVTNPPLNLLLLGLYWLGAGYTKVYSENPHHLDHVVTTPWHWVILGLLEVVVVVVEWRILVWALAGSAGTSRKLLVVSMAMNTASATLGTLAVSYVT